MLRTRVIPSLLLRNDCLVKTVGFDKYTYIGDPCNTVRIFNELEVDELIFLDITASTEKREPNFKVLNDIANECFMPLGYGGGVRSLECAKLIFDIGFEKIVLNTHAIERPELISEIADHFGSQSVIVSIDVKKNIFGRQTVRGLAGKKNTRMVPVEWAKTAEEYGAGEILLTSIDREGSWSGFDLNLVKSVALEVSIPVVAHGGAGSVQDVYDVVKQGGASAVAVGSMVTFQKKGMGVLINFPDQKSLNDL